jgi:hypothetical protein
MINRVWDVNLQVYCAHKVADLVSRSFQSDLGVVGQALWLRKYQANLTQTNLYPVDQEQFTLTITVD